MEDVLKIGQKVKTLKDFSRDEESPIPAGTTGTVEQTKWRDENRLIYLIRLDFENGYPYSVGREHVELAT